MILRVWMLESDATVTLTVEKLFMISYPEANSCEFRGVIYSSAEIPPLHCVKWYFSGNGLVHTPPPNGSLHLHMKDVRALSSHETMISDKLLTSIMYLVPAPHIFCLFNTLSFHFEASANPREAKQRLNGWRHYTEAGETETSVRIQGFGFGVGTHTHTFTLVLRGSALRWWKASITSYSTVSEPEPHPFWHKDTCTYTHFILFCFTLAFSHIHFVSAGGRSSYTMSITTPGWASQASISTSVP